MSKLWLISQDEKNGYDTYSDAVVCADTENDARHIHPSGYYKYHDGKLWFRLADGTERAEDYNMDDTWAHPDKVDAKYIGEAAPDVEVGVVVCASFHAG